MSLFDYKESIELSKNDPSFAALIMAAIRKADSNNLNKLRYMWPEIYEELETRYHCPGGVLPGEPTP